MSATTFLTPALRAAASEVSTLLKARNETISVAETAAGGLISAALLAQPGASKYYMGGLTLYTLPSRLAYAGWTSSSISNYSGPTPAIVTGLATHTLNTLASTYCVSESGTAGPTGGETRNRRPGYVALAVVKREGGGGEGKGEGEGKGVRVWTKEVETGSSEREENMVSFAVEALRLVGEVIKGEAGEGEVQMNKEGEGKEGEGKL